MSSQQGSPQKGKAPQYGSLRSKTPILPRDDESDNEGEAELQSRANTMALQQAQVRQAIEIKDQAAKIQSLSLNVDKVLDLLQRIDQSQRSTEVQQTPAETSAQAAAAPSFPASCAEGSPAPSSQSVSHSAYKPKQKDPPRFDNNQGTIKYTAWKEQILDKFEIDADQFPTARAFMSYVFNRTEGEANDHLFPRYTRDEENTDPFASYLQMLRALDAIYKDPFHVRNSRNAYKDLRMGQSQCFQEFKTRFIQLANGGRIPAADRFDDMYDKMTTALQGQILNQRHTLEGDFERLCEVATGIDGELKRLTNRRIKEREARLKPSTLAGPPSQQLSASKPAFVARPTTGGFALLQKPPAAAAATSTAQKSLDLPPLRCYNCNELGHIASNCLKPKRATIKDIEEEVADVEGDTEEDSEPGKEDA
jgi:Zinc knuckle